MVSPLIEATTPTGRSGGKTPSAPPVTMRSPILTPASPGRNSNSGSNELSPASTARRRAVLAGDNSLEPLLLFLPGDAGVRIGDRIVTGGAEGVFPPDLPVGVVASINGDTIRVAPYAQLAR